MNIQDLYCAKGQLITQLESLQGQLNHVNAEIQQHLNSPPPTAPAPEADGDPAAEDETANAADKTEKPAKKQQAR